MFKELPGLLLSVVYPVVPLGNQQVFINLLVTLLNLFEVDQKVWSSFHLQLPPLSGLVAVLLMTIVEIKECQARHDDINSFLFKGNVTRNEVLERAFIGDQVLSQVSPEKIIFN